MGMDWSSLSIKFIRIFAHYQNINTLTLIYRLSIGTMDPISKKKLEYSRKHLNRSRNVKDFPPPYPNTWYFVTRSEDLGDKEVRPLQMLGKELVLFRDGQGKVGILDAYCPHLGAHLGHGGTIDEDTGNLKCPFHEWEFDTEGKCKKIPYCTKKDISVYSGIHNSKYHVREQFGLVFMW